MSLNVGELVGYLRLDMGDFESGMAKGQALADKLDGKDVNVNVDANTAGAETKLAAVAASEAKVDEGNKKISQSGQDAGRGMGLLSMAIVGLGPALAPLLAGAAGLAVGFGAMGAAGILAVVGISQEMKAGTGLGAAYTAMLGTLKADLTTLGRTAASGTLAPFQQAVADLQTKMPALNGIIGEFSAITGRTAGALMTGLVAAFIALAPLARDAGTYILTLSQHFAAAMSGPGVVSFGDYVRSVFPQVMQAVESIVGAVVHLVAALAPLGMGTLTMLKVFSDVISALPVDVLSNLATVAIPLFIGFKTFGLLSGGILAVSTALTAVGVSAETAAGGILALNIAAGAIGALVAIAMLAFTVFSGATQQATQATNDYTDALIRSNGAIDANVREMAFKHLSDAGGLADAKALGLDLSLVTDAMMGNVPASRALGAQMAAMTTGSHESGAAFLTQQTHINNLSGILGTSTAQFGTATQAQKDHAAATATTTAAITPAAAAQDALAAKVGTTSAALALAATGQKTTADAAANAAAKMYVENDAAGILKTSLDILNGKALNAAQAQNSFDSSLVNMGDHVNATGKKITFTTTSIKDMSSASVALRGQLNSQVTNLQNVVEANGGLSESTGKARAQMVTMRQQIIDNAVAHGVNRAAVTAYVDKLLAIPKKLPPTPLDVTHAAADASIVDFQKRIDAIKQGKVPGIDANSAAGKAVIAALQKAIDNIKQGKPPGITADITPAQAQRAAIQNEIDRIKQGKVPAIDVNTAAGREAIRILEAQKNAIKDKTVTVGVKANFSMGTGGANSFGFFTNAPGGADGGPVTGGTPGKDSVLRTLMPKEFIVRADGSNLADAAAYYAGGAPGMANGGVVGMLPPSLNPTRMNQASEAFTSTVKFDPMKAIAAMGGGGGGGGGGAAQWASTVLAVLAVMGQPSSLLAGVLRLINKESGGNARAINLTDSNAMAGTPSIGLIQTILPTFLANAGPYAALGPYNAFANIFAGLNHAISAWGSIAAVDPLVHPGGYALGTNNAAPGYAVVGERGKEIVHFGGGEGVTPNNMLGGADMSGVRAELAEQTRILRSLVPGFDDALNRQARTQRTYDHGMVGAL